MRKFNYLLLTLFMFIGGGSSALAGTLEQLQSIASIDENAEYVLGIEGTGMHSSGISSWGKCSNVESEWLKYKLVKADDGNSFKAYTNIGGTVYYLLIHDSSNTFAMNESSTAANSDLIIGTTQVSGTNYAVANKTTTNRHLRINGTNGLRSYAGTTGNMAFFYKVGQSAPVVYHNVTIDSNITGGTVSASNNNVAEGAKVTITATPNNGYVFKQWNVTGSTVENENSETTTFTMGESDVTVSATFVKFNGKVITFNFGDASVYPEGFPTKNNTQYTTATEFTFGTNKLIIKTANGGNAYQINSTTDASRALFFGKTVKFDGASVTDISGTCYLGFPAQDGYKLTKVVVTNGSGCAAGISTNIYSYDKTAMSTAVSTAQSGVMTFELSSSEPNTAYYFTASAGQTAGKNLQIRSIELIYEKVAQTSTTITIGTTGFATYFDSENNLQLPEDLDAYTYQYEEGDLVAWNLKDDHGTSVIPAGVAVVLYKNGGGEFSLAHVSEAKWDADYINEYNNLRGEDGTKEVTAGEDETLYILGNGSKGIGFYQAYADGENSFSCGAHKAYLAVPSTSNKAPFISLGFGDETTAIENAIVNSQKNGVIYNLAGQKVDNSFKGIVIINGKKYLNK